MIGVDTNVLLRLYVADDDKQHQAAVAFFSERTENDPAYICLIVLIEFVWSLRRTYKYPRDEVTALAARLLEARDIYVERADLIAEALDITGKSRIGLADAIIAIANLADGCTHTVTFDNKAARELNGVELLT
ncbi:type II toxin-antitoxin system VapC family toxin [Aquamicrobium sp. LC103]|uniref:PIN domain-containing protein n=1 Tax=Aquamicrobium sp. LC103 TaxID=1120658 RepID=UPI00063EADDB|nr:type II toxin-antitoxin system VapC family toxin [Aquamicrobium sp. LC103]TKT75372.1 type II toxin-antitoxin system VapC family toxin [Aquamicrobium sp. LC103]